MKPVPFDSFGGMATRWPAEKLPPKFTRQAKNVQFLGDGVRTRDGCQVAFEGPTLTKPITGLGQFTLTDGTWVPIAFDSSGKLFKETPAGSGGTAEISTLTSDLYMDGVAAQNRFYMAFSDLQDDPNTPKVYFKYAANNTFYLDSIGLAPNSTPVTGAASTATSGDIPTGDRYVVVLFKTRSGYIGGMTDDSVFKVTVSTEGKTLLVTGIPVGPSNCIARVLAFTEAGASSAGPYFYIALDDTLEELNNPSVTKTIIEDNITTALEVNFTDDYIVGTEDVTNFFNKIALPDQSSVYFSKTLRRLIWAGEDQSIFRVSEPEDFETYLSTTGFIYPAQGEGQKAITSREFKGELYLIKAGSGHLVADTSTDPSSWKTYQKWEIGCFGSRAVDTSDDFMVIAGDDGLYTWDGVNMTWRSYEVSGSKVNGELSWDRINRSYGHLVWVTIDPTAKEIHIGVPLDTSTTISHEFICNYSDGWSRRKWSYTDLAFTTLVKLNRTLVGNDVPNEARKSQLCGASSGPTGRIMMIYPGSLSDDGKGFLGEYVTRFEPPPSYGGIFQVTSVDVMVQGAGQLTIESQTLSKTRQLRMLDLVPDKFITHNIKTSGQSEQWSFRFTNNGDAGNWFSIQRITGYFNEIWQRRTI